MSETKESVERHDGSAWDIFLRQKKIRVVVDFGSLSSGKGAPQASLQLMEMIRKKGYEGTFEIIPMSFPPASSVPEEVALSREAQTMLDDAVKKDGKGEVIFDTKTLTPCAIGFTGAFDRDHEDSAENALYYKGVGCKQFITLSTQGWYIYIRKILANVRVIEWDLMSA